MMAQRQQKMHCKPSAQHQPSTSQHAVSGKYRSFLQALVKMSLILCSLQRVFNVIFSLQELSSLVFLVIHLY